MVLIRSDQGAISPENPGRDRNIVDQSNANRVVPGQNIARPVVKFHRPGIVSPEGTLADELGNSIEYRFAKGEERLILKRR